MAKDLFQDSQGLVSPFLPVQETQNDIETSLLEIVFHLTSVLLCVDFDEMLEPLRGIVIAPRHMLVSLQYLVGGVSNCNTNKYIPKTVI